MPPCDPSYCCLYIVASGTHGCIVRYHNEVYKCLYDTQKTTCNATASYIYTNYHVISWNRQIAAINCSVSKYAMICCYLSF